MNILHRIAGVGSLGRPRYMLLAKWKGGLIARETKPGVPSACYFAARHVAPYKSYQVDIINRSIRAPDPGFTSENGWLLRKLTPEAGSIDAGDLSNLEDEAELFYKMGWEIANVHIGSPKVAIEGVQNDLKNRPQGWLLSSATAMKSAIEQDFILWQKYWSTHKSSTAPQPIDLAAPKL